MSECRGNVDSANLMAQVLGVTEGDLGSVLDTVPAGVVIIDPETREIARVNRAAAELIGLPPDSILGRVCHRFVCPAAVDACPILDKGETVDNSERVLLTAAGDRVPILKSVRALELGGRTWLVEAFLDLSQRKRAETLLAESEERHRALFESSRDAIMTLEPPSWRFTSGNPACVSMFRARDEAEFTSLPPWEWSPDHQPDGRPSADKAREMIEEAMATGSHFFEWQHRRRDREDFPATVLLTRLDLRGQRFLQATVRDITHEKRLQGEATRLKTLQAVVTLARGVAHEVNNPLNGIMNYAQLTVDSAPSDSRCAEFAAQILPECRRVARITHALLEAVQDSAECEQAVSVSRLVDTVEARTRRALETAGITLTVDVPPGLPDISCRRGQIIRALVNIIQNACDALAGACPAQDRLPELRITASLAPTGTAGRVVLRIEDNGPGMAPETAERVFEPFFTTRDRTQHSGLGLSVAYRVVAEHGGDLVVATEAGRFCRVDVWLPVGQRADGVEIGEG